MHLIQEKIKDPVMDSGSTHLDWDNYTNELEFE